MDEILKVVGGLVWVVALVTLFAYPPLGVGVLVVAVLLTTMSVMRTRERRHREILDATRKNS